MKERPSPEKYLVLVMLEGSHRSNPLHRYDPIFPILHDHLEKLQRIKMSLDVRLYFGGRDIMVVLMCSARKMHVVIRLRRQDRFESAWPPSSYFFGPQW